ncbi:Aflatoxin biosynthesis regulatory protein [Colletotrichum tanaceti]|nr:Aflatoxin biosynthesis regulatory protein [Colletotrichum tanaceti]
MAPGARRDDAGGHETKLRNSCDTCAAAKIKCTQEKPACAYCVKRLRPCVYGASKRVRRTQRSLKQHHQQQHTPGVSRSPKSPTAAAATTATTTTTTTTAWSPPQGAERASSFPAPGTVSGAETASSQQAFAFATPPMTGHQDWPDFLTALMSPSITPSSAEPFASTELDSAGVTLESFTYIEDSAFSSSTPPLSSIFGDRSPAIRTGAPAFRHGSSSSADSAAGKKDVGLGWLTGDHHGSSAEETRFSRPGPGTDAGAASSNSNPFGTPSSRVRPRSRPGPPPPPPRCQCFARVLRFVAQLSTDPSRAWSSAAEEEKPDYSDAPRRRRRRLANLGNIANDRIAHMSDGISMVLQCPCSRDAEMIVLLSLLIFKIQVCYVDAVNAATDDGAGGGPGPVDSCFPWNDAANDCDEDDDGEEEEDGDDDDNDDDDDDEDRHRVFVQHILSRLAGLRALITRLSERLAEPESYSSFGFPGASCRPTLPRGPSHYSVVEGRIDIAPFSAASLAALSSDLRNRLSGMSQAISGKLREG